MERAGESHDDDESQNRDWLVVFIKDMDFDRLMVEGL
jgi:hypothetical protein